MANAWIDFVKKHWPASKKKGMSYKAHLKAMAGKYKKGGAKKGGKLKKQPEMEMEMEVEEEKPKKRRRRKVAAPAKKKR